MRNIILILIMLCVFISLIANESEIVERTLGHNFREIPLKIVYSGSLMDNDNDLEYEIIVDIKFEYMKDHPSYVGDEEIEIILLTTEHRGRKSQTEVKKIPLGPHQLTLDDDRIEISTQLKLIYPKPAISIPGFGIRLDASMRFLRGGLSYPEFWDETLKDMRHIDYYSFDLVIPGMII